MKAFTALVLATLLVSVSIIALPACANGEPSVGVKEGDWIEYNVTVTGNPPPVHRNVTWWRLEVLQVEGTAFPANVTVGYANGTVESTIWEFNFSEGNTEGWVIIPSNLSPGDAFFDNYSKTDKHIVIQSEEQKTVLGASRTVTYANDSYRDKYWDKATGVFIASSEVFKNWSAYVTASATNMWSPQILGLNYGFFYALASASIALAGLASSAVILATRRQKTTAAPLSYRSQRNTAVLVVAAVLLVMGAISLIPVSQSQLSLNFHELNLVMQTFWTGLVLVSMWLRKKGHYFAHELTMLVVVSALIVSFSGVLLMSPPSSNTMGIYFSSPLYFAVFISHAVLSIPPLIFGVWLVALWRPGSTTFAAKSKTIARLTMVFWVLSYGAGVLGFLGLHTTLFL